MLPVTDFLFQQVYNVSVGQGSIISAGSILIEETITLIVMLLTILAFSIQVARGYFLRVLKKFTLRVAADIWWLLYIVLRDASIFLIVFFGAELLWTGTYGDYPLAVPFTPFAIAIFAIALVIMLVKDTDEEPLYNNMVTILVAIGAIMYIFGITFITESALQYAVSPLPPTVSTSTSNIWGYMYQTFNSQNNPALAIYTFYITFAVLGICGLVALVYSFGGSTPRGGIKTIPKPIVKEPQPPSPQPQKK
jgi:hypothetical protein